MKPFTTKALYTVAVTLTLASCGGSGGSEGNVPLNDQASVQGVLVIPESADLVAQAALMPSLRQALQRNGNTNCPNVPDGYDPLSNASVSFVDNQGETVGNSFLTDECGEFNEVPGSTATGITATSAGFRTLNSDLTLFTNAATPGIASTIADTATYRIGAIQALSDQQIAFTVTDSVTNQAVLGIPQDAFQVSLDDAPATLDNLTVAASTNTAASTILTLDASFSMSGIAFDDPDTGESFNRYQLAARAAHTFLDQKSANDEVATQLFSSNIFFMNQETIDDRLSLVDELGADVQYTLSTDGFVTDESRMRFVIDAYNRESDFYSSGDDLRHPDSPSDITISNGYRFSGATALYDAIGESIAILDNRGSERPIVIAMTDGSNNSSARSEEEVIQEAIASNVPVFTIGFGGSTRTDSLTRIAEQTGGTFFNVESIDISNAFQSIQTGIVFQYISSLTAGGIDTAMTLGIALDFNGLQIERTLTLTQ